MSSTQDDSTPVTPNQPLILVARTGGGKSVMLFERLILADLNRQKVVAFAKPIGLN